MGAPELEHCCGTAGAACRMCQLESITDEFRTALGGWIGATDLAAVSGDVSTNLRPGLFEAWTAFSGDPDVEPAKWLRYGAPIGVLHHPVDCGIFPVT
eukprot:1334584-Heterocapsa_arctica.AAC.1